MKTAFLLSFFLSLNVLAVDTISFQIDHLNFSGDHGTVNSKEIVIGAGTDSIGYKGADNDLFEGIIEVKNKMLTITAGNGMFIKSSSPVDLINIPETEVTSGQFFSEPTKLGLIAQQLSTSISNIHLDVTNLNFNCTEGANCNGKADTLLIDHNMLVKSPEFVCTKANCISDFTLALSSLADGKNFVVKNIQTKSFISMKDLRTVTLRRAGNSLNLTGKVHVVVGVISFEVKADIVTLNDNILELHVGKVKISDFLSVTDFTTFLAEKLLSTKAFTINGDNIVIKLR